MDRPARQPRRARRRAGRALVPKPAGVPWDAAGALFVAGVTAYAAVRAVGRRPGDTVVVSGAAGGVGSLDRAARAQCRRHRDRTGGRVPTTSGCAARRDTGRVRRTGWPIGSGRPPAAASTRSSTPSAAATCNWRSRSWASRPTASTRSSTGMRRRSTGRRWTAALPAQAPRCWPSWPEMIDRGELEVPIAQRLSARGGPRRLPRAGAAPHPREDRADPLGRASVNMGSVRCRATPRAPAAPAWARPSWTARMCARDAAR